MLFCAVFTCEQPAAWLIYTVYRDKDWVETTPTAYAIPSLGSPCQDQQGRDSPLSPSPDWPDPSNFYSPDSQ